jgi:tetratricopeptide (TPR) repeat protein
VESRTPGSNPIVLTLEAMGLAFLGSWREAMAHAQRAVDLNPNIALSHVNLALACLHFNRPDEAIAHIDAAAILAPRGYQTNLALGYKGLAHFQAGRYEQALRTMEEALLLHPNLYILKDKAVVCEKLGQHEDASDAIRRLRTAEPSVTLDGIERANSIVFAPDTANEMNAILRKLWRDTPVP